MNKYQQFKTVKKTLNYAGVIWYGKKELKWLYDTYYAINGFRLSQKNEYHNNILKAGILGAIYTELCYKLVGEMGLCRVEGLINGLKICFEECTEIDSDTIEKITAVEIVKREHNKVVTDLIDYYYFKEGEEWDIQIVNDMISTFTDIEDESSSLYMDMGKKQFTISDHVKIEKFGNVYEWIENGFELNHQPFHGS